MGRILGAFLLLAIPLGDVSEAQGRRIFVGGGAIADDDRTNSALTQGAVASWTIAAGLDIAPHVGVRIFLDAPRQVGRVAEGIYTRAPSLIPVHERLTGTRRSMTYGIVADLHAEVMRHLRVAATAGLVTVTHDSELVVVRHELRPDGSRVRLTDLTDRGDHDWGGFTLGLEAALRFAGRIEVVPEVRVIYFILSDSPSPYILRSGIGMRVRF